MISFAKEKLGWLNKAVRNTNISIKEKIAAKYSEPETKENHINNNLITDYEKPKRAYSQLDLDYKVDIDLLVDRMEKDFNE